MSIPLRIVATAIIAAVMAAVGMALIDLDGDGMIVACSVGLWLLLSMPLAALPLPAGAYIGLLSPFLGCMMFSPLGLVVILVHPVECLCTGLITGLLVSTVWRHGRHHDVFELYP